MFTQRSVYYSPKMVFSVWKNMIILWVISLLALFFKVYYYHILMRITILIINIPNKTLANSQTNHQSSKINQRRKYFLDQDYSWKSLWWWIVTRCLNVEKSYQYIHSETIDVIWCHKCVSWPIMILIVVTINLDLLCI